MSIKELQERLIELKETPSLIEAGEGVTMYTAFGGLYLPYTVIEIRRDGRELVIQRDKVERVTPGGWADDGEKRYHRNPDGEIETITKRNDGTYIVKGEAKEPYSTRYTVGYRREWTDYSQ